MDILRFNSRASRLIYLLSLLTNIYHDIVSAVEGCPCPPLKNKTKPFHQMQSYPRGHKFFYACIDGYVRKAGTSSMTRCTDVSGSKLQWDNISGTTSFICIPDPKRKKTPEADPKRKKTPEVNDTQKPDERHSSTVPVGNDTQKQDERHSSTVPIGLGSGVGVLLLIAVTVGVALMLQRQCFSRSRSADVPTSIVEHVPLQPREIHQPKQEQPRSSTT
ncbi:interleukin-15 receptor subunit alpha isoform X1 [Conger conger]|nr:interleukin-15 receptor subunit alpha isoform X1 [Conger conger]